MCAIRHEGDKSVGDTSRVDTGIVRIRDPWFSRTLQVGYEATEPGILLVILTATVPSNSTVRLYGRDKTKGGTNTHSADSAVQLKDRSKEMVAASLFFIGTFPPSGNLWRNLEIEMVRVNVSVKGAAY